MKNTKMSRYGCMGLISAFLTVLLAGCGSVPSPEAVMEGTWKMTTEADTGLTQTLLTFDQRGELASITFQSGILTITYDNELNTKTTVNGNSVTINATFLGSSLIFNGTLNSDKTVIVGTVTMRIQVFSLTISIDEGAATLTRQ